MNRKIILGIILSALLVSATQANANILDERVEAVKLEECWVTGADLIFYAGLSGQCILKVKTREQPNVQQMQVDVGVEVVQIVQVGWTRLEDEGIFLIPTDKDIRVRHLFGSFSRAVPGAAFNAFFIGFGKIVGENKNGIQLGFGLYKVLGAGIGLNWATIELSPSL